MWRVITMISALIGAAMVSPAQPVLAKSATGMGFDLSLTSEEMGVLDGRQDSTPLVSLRSATGMGRVEKFAQQHGMGARAPTEFT
jgi:hypothetical protein